MPVLPVAPGTLTTGKETLRSSSIILPDFRATWSDPPPGPHGTMNSIGRDGYFSCAKSGDASIGSRNARDTSHRKDLNERIACSCFLYNGVRICLDIARAASGERADSKPMP